MTDLFSIEGKVALVTGSTRGIGLALADGLAAAGCRVIVHGRDAEKAASVAAGLTERNGGDHLGIAFDATRSDEVERAASDLDARGIPVEIVVNNAGIQRRRQGENYDFGDWDDVLATNLSAVFYVGQIFSRAMIARGSGKIVNIGSVQSQLGRPGITPYAASKGGVVMLTRGMCADLGASGVQVNCVAPGYFETELTQALVADERFSAWVADRTPAGRWGKVDDLVGAVRFFAAPASDFVTGQVLYVDGGMTAVV